MRAILQIRPARRRSWLFSSMTVCKHEESVHLNSTCDCGVSICCRPERRAEQDHVLIVLIHYAKVMNESAVAAAEVVNAQLRLVLLSWKNAGK
jgi:hypothetical protein